VGSARTAIFNWLFARRQGGKFLLRIEDTDAARSEEHLVTTILDALQWLGLTWDEPPVFQSQRLALYKQAADRLIADKKAYKCFASREELEAARAKALQENRPYKYDRRGLRLSQSEIEAFEAQGKPYVVRLLVEEGRTEFYDEIYGNIKVSHDELDDFIILRSDGYPTYHLAVVVDDHDMGITHVIRGDDHLSNTPKHVLLYRALGWHPPLFAHLPLILGPDRKRLSKRHGAKGIGEFQQAGYAPEAVLNFLALMGWSPGDDREYFSREELAAAFSLDRVSKTAAVFDETKLDWLNGQYIHRMPDSAFCERVISELQGCGIVEQTVTDEDRQRLESICLLIKPRVKKFTEIAGAVQYFFQHPASYDEKGVAKHWRRPGVAENMEKLIERLETMESFTEEKFELVIRGLAEELGVSAAKLIHPVRLALTGQTASPGLFEVMALLGAETVLLRLRKAVEFLKNIS